jgi:hypothetical protein
MTHQGNVDMSGKRHPEGFKYQHAGMLCQATSACYTCCQHFCASGNLNAH